jgi:1-acyl-sn-glycerol-3-phosphate acyltransferase
MIIYHFLKLIIGLSIRLYYKEIKVKGKDVIDQRHPTIIIANHPNTLMDAWMIGFVCKKPIYYMSKGTFFNSWLKRWVLNSLGLIPVNRAVDSKTSGVSNEDSFEMCYRILEQGKTLVIFPEGNSFNDRHLRKLKSGTARIALEAENRNHGKLNLKIIPLGLIYTRAEKFRSSVMVNIGKPVSALPYLELFKEDRLKSARQLTNSLSDSLERLLVNAQSKVRGELGDKIVAILSSNYVKSKKKGVEKELIFMKEINDQLNLIYLTEPWKISKIEKLIEKVQWQSGQYKVKTSFFDRKYHPVMFVRQIFLSIMLLFIGLPVFLLGMIHNYPQYLLTDWITSKLVDEVEYYAPMALLISLVTYPLFYTGFLITFSYFFDLNWMYQLAYFLNMPLLRLLACSFIQYFTHVRYKLKFMAKMKVNQELLTEINNNREKIKSLIFN